MIAAGEVGIETWLEVHHFLVAEAELLDDRRFEEWLELFTDDVEYTAPVRVHRKNPAPDVVEANLLFDENKASLGLRVKRLYTDVAWAEDPPSLTRRMVSNIRVTPGPGDDELAVKSNLLLFRNRGDLGRHDLIAGQREDVLRRVDGALRIARRRAVLDQASIGTKNLAVFL
ncbi:MAG: 3-phenylpropionate/cinnamic acid dioxygenase subunit beta [Solirubrobacterales bacterium]|nr:3-phenylpropionate/cinnamic acid dioxygenase subunit beta [Solirubrobacterales bacterium]